MNSNTPVVESATGNVMDTVVDGVGEYIQPLKDKGEEAIGTLTDGVNLEIPDYTSEMDNLMNGGLTTIEGYDGEYVLDEVPENETDEEENQGNIL